MRFSLMYGSRHVTIPVWLAFSLYCCQSLHPSIMIAEIIIPRAYVSADTIRQTGIFLSYGDLRKPYPCLCPKSLRPVPALQSLRLSDCVNLILVLWKLPGPRSTTSYQRLYEVADGCYHDHIMALTYSSKLQGREIRHEHIP